MKKLFSYLPKKLFVFILSVIAVIGIAVSANATFGPDRPTYTMQNPADHVTFNSITDNPAMPNGDERTFLTGALPGASDYSDPVNNVKDGDEITLLMYVHNDAAENLNLTANNTKVKVVLPTETKKNQVVTGYISADNATPKEVSDTLDINGSNNIDFKLEYITGSAKFKNNIFTNGTALADSIVTTGALVGYDKIDGVMPGCNKFSGWVTLKVKVTMPNYTIEKKARIAGETGADKWRETVTAKATDTIEWLIEVKNVGSTTLSDIIVLDQVPNNMTVVPGSVKLINSTYPSSNPYIYPSQAIQANGKQINVNVGTYGPGNNLFVRFDTKVTDVSKLECGENKFVNEAFATPEGDGSIVDKAYVIIDKDCGQATYRCDMLTLTTTTGRGITAKVDTTATNGATLSTITYDFGDGSQKLVSNQATVNYTYAQDGTYTVKAVPTFKLDGTTATAESEDCIKQVKFGGELPNTGPSSLVGLFAGTTIASALGYRLWMIRRLGR